MFLRLSLILAPLLLIASSLSATPEFLPQGEGSETTGGQGGKVCKVTRLDADSKGNLQGSLQYCLNKDNQIVVFETGGTIEVTTPIKIHGKKNITLAGHTAPGGGITVRGKKNYGSANGLLSIRSSQNIIIRNISLRSGPAKEDKGANDALSISNSKNILVDHVSASWATDEVASVWEEADKITIQNSSFCEGLYESTHPEKRHSRGLLMRGPDNGKVTLYRNLFCHNNFRNPQITNGIADIVNNVIYNSGRAAVLVYAQSPDEKGRDSAYINVVGNTLKYGQNTDRDDPLVNTARGEKIGFYARGNQILDRNGKKLSNKTYGKGKFKSNKRYDTAKVSEISSEESYKWVLENVGNSYAVSCDGSFIARRDNIDSRVINDVKRGTGRIIDHPNQVGGWATISRGSKCTDSDDDGMPDQWEYRVGLQPKANDNQLDPDRDGSTNIEEYLNGTNPMGDNKETAQRLPLLPKNNPQENIQSLAPNNTPLESSNQNGVSFDFETGSNELWELYYDEEAGIGIPAILVRSNSGTGSQDVLTVVLNGKGIPVEVGQGEIPLQAGKEYRLTLDLKGINVSSVALNMREDAQGGENIGLQDYHLPVSSGSIWQPHEILFTAPKTTNNARFSIGVDNPQTSQLYVDNVILTQTEDASLVSGSNAMEPGANNHCAPISIEAEHGTRMPPFREGNDESASGNRYIWVPENTKTYIGFWKNPPYLEYKFSTNQSGTYHFRGWVHAATSKADSAYIQIDDQEAHTWQITSRKKFGESYLETKRNSGTLVEFDLETGDHALRIFLREDGLKLDKFSLEMICP